MVKRTCNGCIPLYHRIISSWTLRFIVLFGRTMLLVTTTSSSTATASPDSDRWISESTVNLSIIPHDQKKKKNWNTTILSTKNGDPKFCIVISISLWQAMKFRQVAKSDKFVEWESYKSRSLENARKAKLFAKKLLNLLEIYS